MFAGRSTSKETTTLHWKMPDSAWVHWARGRGEKSVRDVIIEGMNQIHLNPKAVKERCDAIRDEARNEPEDGPKHEIRIELPADGWARAIQRVGPTSTGELLGALILTSESWRQAGSADAEYRAGWHKRDLISSLDSYTAKTAGLSLAREEKILARTLAVAAVIGAGAAVASAVAAWCMP